jgi:hypothetical protein
VKALPNGLALSEAGTITGTPLRRGSYRAIVELQDSAGNLLHRTFGMGIGVIAPGAVRAANRNLLKSSGSDACSQTASQTEFSGGDANVVLATTLQAPPRKRGKGRVAQSPRRYIPGG